MRAGDKRSKISEDLRVERRALAEAMNALYEHVKQYSAAVNSQAALTDAILIAEAGYLGANTMNLSKYLAGKHVPPTAYLAVFHKVIAKETSDHQMPLTLGNLLDLHRKAASTDRRLRAVRQQERVSTMRELSDTKRQLEQARQQIAGMSAQETPPVALPVPPAAGDRQGSDFTQGVPPAAAELIQLSKSGRHEQAHTLLTQLPSHFSAEEMASCIVHFRENGEDELANTLIRICGQEASQGAILVTMSRVLRRRNLHLDAETLLDQVV